ncbi:MAG TPA: hypothetical protein VF188_02845 [Longimicrobiales bacterium]
MPRRLTAELLSDSEETLRLVDALLEELRGHDPGDDRIARLLDELTDREPGLSVLPLMLLRAYDEITRTLDVLRRSRGAIERAAVERVQHTHAKLREVSSATELAATDMLDGLDRALGLLDQLDAAARDRGDPNADDERLRAELRDEVFRLIGCLQFQDITAQQLGHASSALLDVEQRLDAIAQLFDPGAMLADEAPGADRGSVFDPAASMSDAERRQALVDEIFTTCLPQQRTGTG